MIVGLDTSVVVRVLTNDPPDLATVAGRFLNERRAVEDRVLVSDWVLAETYYALQYHYRVPKKDGLHALRTFLASPEIEGTGDVAEVLETSGLESTNPGFIDRVIHRNYLRGGADGVATFEKATKKLPKVRVLTA